MSEMVASNKLTASSANCHIKEIHLSREDSSNVNEKDAIHIHHQTRAWNQKLEWFENSNWSKKRKEKTSKKPLLVPAVAATKPGAISCELTCLQSSSLIAQQSVEKKNINK
jgi:hypothetical protein